MRYFDWLERRLGAWGAYAAHHRGRILLFTLLLTLLALPGAYHAVTHLDVNLFNQASDKLPRFKLARELSEDFGGDILAAVLTIPDSSTPEQISELKSFGLLLSSELAKVGTFEEDAASLPQNIRDELSAKCDANESTEELAPGVAGSTWLRHVECRSGQGMEQALRRIARQYPHVVLSPSDVDALKTMFEPQRLAQKMDSIASTLESLPSTSLLRSQLQEDPLQFSDLGKDALQQRLAKRKQALGATDPEGYFLSADRTTLVVLARTILPANRLDFNRALMAAVQRAENRAIQTFRKSSQTLSVALKAQTYAQLASGESPGTLAVGFTGMPAVSVENEMSLKYDLLSNITTSFIGVLLLFLIVFRLLWLAWDVSWTTAIVIIWTLGIAGATRGSISVMGGAFACILLGTGTDYAIHLHNTFHHFRQAEGLPIDEALRRTLARCGPGILTAAFTSSLAFLGVAFTQFSGLAEFGLLAGISILLGCAVMLLVFPALLARSSSRPAPEALGLGLPTWGRVLERRGVPALSLLLGVAVLVGAILFIRLGPDPGPEAVGGVRFDTEFGNLRSLNIKAIPLRNHLADKFGLGLADLRVVIDAKEEATAYAGAEDTLRRLQPFVDRGELSAGGSVLDFIPSPRQQAETIAALRSFDFAAASAAFQKAASARFGERGPVFFKPFLRRMQDFQQALVRANILSLSTVMKGPLSHLLASFVKLQPDGGVRLASSWFPSGAQGAHTGASPLGLPPQWYAQVVGALENDPHEGAAIRVTAARMVGFEMKDSLLRDCSWISAMVGICVIIALFTAFRSARSAALALIPLVYAYVSLLSGVAFCQWMNWDFSLNFVNLIMFPLLLGSGIDVGIYLVYEALSVRQPGIRQLMSDTGRSVLCCTLTTLVGFGAFFWSSYTGLISLGVAAFFGYIGALFGALVVLPALLALRRTPQPPVLIEAGAPRAIVQPVVTQEVRS